MSDKTDTALPSARNSAHSEQAPDPQTDPVCGMKVAEMAVAPKEPFGEETYVFCSENCQKTFQEDPYFYASGNSTRIARHMPEGTTYTCPMHPEVTRDAPGDCPICGMALEPVGGSRNGAQ